MTNYEHYKKEIVNIVRLGRTVAIEKETGRITTCNDIPGTCLDCMFYHSEQGTGHNCYKNALEWADAEYVAPGIDWSKVPVDTPILVSSDNVNWKRRHFAKFKNGKVYAWNDGLTSFTSHDENQMLWWSYAKLAEGEKK